MYWRDFIFFSLVSLASTGCTKSGSTGSSASSNPTPVAVQPLVTYLALGDSYTIGQSVQPNERFPFLTVQGLRAGGLNVSDPVYIATTGWTTADLEAAIATQNPPSTFGFVTLLIGVNNQYQHKDTAEYRLGFIRLLQKAIGFAAGKKDHVFVLSIPDYSATPFVQSFDKQRVSTEISWFNKINKEITDQNGVAYINITPLTLEAQNDATLLASDGLHYSGKEHQKWADLLIPIVKNVIN